MISNKLIGVLGILSMVACGQTDEGNRSQGVVDGGSEETATEDNQESGQEYISEDDASLDLSSSVAPSDKYEAIKIIYRYCEQNIDIKALMGSKETISGLNPTYFKGLTCSFDKYSKVIDDGKCKSANDLQRGMGFGFAMIPFEQWTKVDANTVKRVFRTPYRMEFQKPCK